MAPVAPGTGIAFSPTLLVSASYKGGDAAVIIYGGSQCLILSGLLAQRMQLSGAFVKLRGEPYPLVMRVYTAFGRNMVFLGDFY
jgi:hypothetical protein